MIESLRLEQAYETARDDLLAACDPSGHWIGQLCSSPLATATAVSALAICERRLATNLSGQRCCKLPALESVAPCGEDFSGLICGGLRYLAEHQNSDGGWGDAAGGPSNIATTALVVAAFRLTAVPADRADALERAEQYIAAQGGLRGVRRWFGRDRGFAAPVLANCALAGMIPWREVPQLPFELACLSDDWLARLRLSGARYAFAVLIAIGQARHHHAGSWNPLARAYRHVCRPRSLAVLEQSQPSSGGFWESPPLTSFVVMCLASMGLHAHPVVRRGLQFLKHSVRPDGSWAVGSELSVWNTAQAVSALGARGEKVSELDLLPWLLRCQADAASGLDEPAGGWSWTAVPGTMADTDDTAAALLALDQIVQSDPQLEADRVLIQAGLRGVDWLLGRQNKDGGWASFCQGAGRLPFDRSASDFTASAVRALNAWQKYIVNDERASVPAAPTSEPPRSEQVQQAIQRGLNYLTYNQFPDGSWAAARLGTSCEGATSGSICGTARVLLVYRDVAEYDCVQARRGVSWLLDRRNADGGWGDDFASGTVSDSASARRVLRSTVEETALVVEALLPATTWSRVNSHLSSGLEWLSRAVETGAFKEPAPVGTCFGKFAYSERLFPRVLSVSALGHALAASGRDATTPRRTTETSPT